MSDPFVEVRSVRIVCDPVLKDGVLEQLKELDAPGFTWWEAQGKGHRETVPDVQTAAGWHRGLGSEKRVCIEVWCSRSIAEKILAYCQGSQFRGIGMIAGVEPFWIHRDELAKFAESEK
jgi:nitrogen regulatory protein PII